jgi:hypothetical protein
MNSLHAAMGWATFVGLVVGFVIGFIRGWGANRRSRILPPRLP